MCEVQCVSNQWVVFEYKCASLCTVFHGLVCRCKCVFLCAFVRVCACACVLCMHNVAIPLQHFVSRLYHLYFSIF